MCLRRTVEEGQKFSDDTMPVDNTYNLGNGEKYEPYDPTQDDLQEEAVDIRGGNVTLASSAWEHEFVSQAKSHNVKGGAVMMAPPPAAPAASQAWRPVPPQQVIQPIDLDTLGIPRTPERTIDRLLLARSRMNETIQSAFQELRATSSADGGPAPSQGGIDRLLLDRSRINETIQSAFQEIRATSSAVGTPAPSQGGSKLADVDEGSRPNTKQIAWGQSLQQVPKASKPSRKNDLEKAGLRLQSDIQFAVAEAGLPNAIGHTDLDDIMV